MIKRGAEGRSRESVSNNSELTEERASLQSMGHFAFSSGEKQEGTSVKNFDRSRKDEYSLYISGMIPLNPNDESERWHTQTDNRQQSKIIHFIMSGDENTIEMYDPLEDVPNYPYEEHRFWSGLNRHFQEYRDKEKDFFKLIGRPIDMDAIGGNDQEMARGPKAVFEELLLSSSERAGKEPIMNHFVNPGRHYSRDLHLVRVIGWLSEGVDGFSARNRDNFEHITSRDAEVFTDIFKRGGDYETIIDYEESTSVLLGSLKRWGNPETKINEYKELIDEIGQAVYGAQVRYKVEADKLDYAIADWFNAVGGVYANLKKNRGVVANDSDELAAVWAMSGYDKVTGAHYGNGEPEEELAEELEHYTALDDKRLIQEHFPNGSKAAERVLKRIRKIYHIPYAPEPKAIKPALNHNLSSKKAQEQYELVEHPFRYAGSSTLSLGDVTHGYDTHPGNVNQDAIISDFDNGLFGVFDGVGGYDSVEPGMGSAASHFLSEYFKKNASEIANLPIKDEGEIWYYLEQAGRSAANKYGDMQTGSMGIVARIAKGTNGKTYCDWASVGDSRIYYLPKDGHIEQLSTDEEQDYAGRKGYRPTNYLGVFSDSNRQIGKVSEHNKGLLEVNQGDKIIICSDGVFGDEWMPSSVMDNHEIEEITREASSPLEAARRLVNEAHKEDDRSAIVIEI